MNCTNRSAGREKQGKSLVGRTQVADTADAHASLVSAKADWRGLLECGSRRVFPDGNQLFAQEETADDVFLIQEGGVKLVVTVAKGTQMILGLRWAGWFLGAPSVIAGQTYPATAITLTRCIVLRISATDFLGLLASDTSLARHIEQLHSKEILEQAHRISGLGCTGAKERTLRLLREFLPTRSLYGKTNRIQIKVPLSQKDLADMVPTSPSYLSRIIAELQTEGILELDGGRMFVSEPDRLLLR